MTDLGNNDVSWTYKLEHYFASTGERAHCMSWAHLRAESLFQFRRTFIELPVIVLSSVTGFLSVGSSSLFPNSEHASAGLGAVSLFVAVLNTLGTYYSWAKKSESHRIASLHYAKLYRFINVEMALPREERLPAKDFLKYIKEQYDRLAETSPTIPDQIIKEFHAKFDSELKDISVPEQMNGLEAIYVYNEGDLRKDLQLEANLKILHEAFKSEDYKLLQTPRPSTVVPVLGPQVIQLGSEKLEAIIGIEEPGSSTIVEDSKAERIEETSASSISN